MDSTDRMLWGTWAGKSGTRCCAKQTLPDLKDGDDVLQCYQWERMSRWEKNDKHSHFDSGTLWWLGTRSLLFVGLFLPCCSAHKPRALCEGELQRLHLAKVL